MFCNTSLSKNLYLYVVKKNEKININASINIRSYSTTPPPPNLQAPFPSESNGHLFMSILIPNL